MSTSAVADMPVAAPDRGRTLVEVGVCAALAIAPYLWRVLAGTRRLPNDDNWAYWRIFQTFEETGRIVLIDWNDINLVGMLPLTRVWTAVVGNGPLQVHLLGSVMAFVVLLSTWSLLRSLSSPVVLVAIASVGLFPGFVVTAGTYMADQFAVAGALAALALVVHAVRRPLGAGVVPSLVLVLGAAAGCFFAFSVRQQTAVAAVGVLAVLFVARERLPRMWLVFAAVLGPPALGFYVWRGGLENGGGLWFRFEPPFLVAAGVFLVVTLCVAALPTLVAVAGRDVVASPRVHGAVTIAAVAVALAVDPGGYVNDGLSVVRRVAEASIAVRVVAAVVVANVVAMVVTGAFGRRLDVRDPAIGGLSVVALLAVAADGVSAVLASDYYPRYSLVTVPVLVVLASVSTAARTEPAVVSPAGRATAPAVAILVAVGIGSYWAMDGALVPLRAVQDAADVLECAGVPPERFDGGIVWTGLHDSGTAISQYWNEPLVDDGLPPTQHQRIFPGLQRDAVLLDDLPTDAGDGVVVGTFSASGLLPGNDVTRYLVVRAELEPDVAACVIGS